jgi:hypothetical protein
MSGSGFDGLNPTMTGLGFGKLEYLGVRPEPARRTVTFTVWLSINSSRKTA